MSSNLLPLMSLAPALIMLVFTAFVLQRFLTRRKLSFLFWAIGLALFSAGSFAGAYLTLAWNEWAFFTWYFCGAVLNAAWIGHGTVYLLFRKKWVHTATAVLIVSSLGALALMLQLMPRLDAAQFTTTVPISEQYREIMPAIDEGALIRLTTPFFNIYGLITLVGGALWSAYLFWRKRVLPNRVIANVLIATGALSVALTSTLTRFGNGSLLYVGELAAATLMFAGFLTAARPETRAKAARPARARV